ncbi:MAG TPA: cation transporter [Acidimicrobiales bacterium]|nr:cation transporter [Acidimicrobiales bacterium]
MSTVTYNVPDISCGHCVQAITGAVSPLDGVESVDVSIDDKTVTVEGQFDDAAVREAIDEAGYDIA